MWLMGGHSGGSNQRYALRNQSLEYWTRNSYIQTDRQTYVRRYAHRRLTYRHVAMQKHDPEIMSLDDRIPAGIIFG